MCIVQSATRILTLMNGREKRTRIFGINPRMAISRKKNNKNVPSNANTRWFIFDSSPFKCLNSFPFLSFVAWLAVTMFHSIENWSPSNGYNSIIFLIENKKHKRTIFVAFNIRTLWNQMVPQTNQKVWNKKSISLSCVRHTWKQNTAKQQKEEQRYIYIRIKLIEIEIKFVEKFEINSHISWNWRHF